MDNFNWDLFLDLIKSHQIVPVLGSDLILIRRNNQILPLLDILTLRLSESLVVDPGRQNFREFILKNRDKHFLSDAIKNVFYEILEEEIFEVDHLQKLARITGFKLFLSTTFDNVFEGVLKEERQIRKALKTISYSYPSLAQPLTPINVSEEFNTVVFKVFGSIENKNFATTEEEILEYVFSLKSENPLAETLHDLVQGKNLLFLGCDFPNWLMRFFIRIITDERFKIGNTEKIIADNYAHKDFKLSLFLKHFKTQILKLSDEEFKNPLKFIEELYQRWLVYEKKSVKKIFKGTVFLSFSHQDVEKIRVVSRELSSNGIEVWFDENKLKSGDNYDRIIKDRIKNCKIFIPFISKASLENRESYVYRVEWDMAISRRKIREIDERQKSFIMPIVLDDISFSEERIPQTFRQLTIEYLDLNRLIDNIKKELTLISHEK